MAYNANSIRDSEYPMLKSHVYLDHAGMTPYSSSAIGDFHKVMSTDLYGNPHSEAPSSKLSTQRIQDVRLRVLEFFQGSSNDFDLIFVQNATAAMKLVAEALSQNLPTGSHGDGFWYGYHMESHTSAVGVRRLAQAGSVCFQDDEAVERWLQAGDLGPNHTVSQKHDKIGIFAYPGQSNMTGRRLPRSWPGTIRRSSLPSHLNVYTLLDAAALASTKPLDLEDVEAAPDFTVVSFLKIFGFPDLGGLIVRRDSARILERKQYFGGGTVEMVINGHTPWHSMKRRHPHEYLEDGTLPVHSILALGCALDAHLRLYKLQKNVTEHVTHLALRLFERLSSLQHSNGSPVCVVYKHSSADYRDSETQGPVVAFNIRDVAGRWLRLSQLDGAANKANIHLRTGDVCNPGGIASTLDLAPWESFRNFAAGIRCGCKNIVIGGKPSGIARVSLGAMSTIEDVDGFVSFIESRFRNLKTQGNPMVASESHLFINTILIYPIYGCSGWRIPPGMAWEVGQSGLRWDCDWCIIDKDKNEILTQEAVPQLALVRPEIDTSLGFLFVRIHESLRQVPEIDEELCIPIWQVSEVETLEVSYETGTVSVQACTSNSVVEFLSKSLRRCCTIARFDGLGICGCELLQTVPDVMVVRTMAEDLQIQTEARKTLPNPSEAVAPAPSVRRSIISEPANNISLRPPQEVLAESMGANVVLATAREISNPKLDDNWTFVNLGRQYTENASRESMFLTHEKTGVDAGKVSEEFRIAYSYHVARISRDTLPRESLRLDVPKDVHGLSKVRWAAGDCLHREGPLDVWTSQQWELSPAQLGQRSMPG